MKFAALVFFLLPAGAETLHYAINWPSGLSLGEATLTSVSGRDQWSFDFDLDAAVPGFALRDHYRSIASLELCSSELDKVIQHGNHKSEETVTFHQDTNTITRETKSAGGGKSDVAVPSCARDAMAFVQFARKELAQGRLAPQQPVVLGSLYNVRLEFAGTETVKTSKPVQADRIHATIKGPSSNLALDILFAKDQARTPVLARIPLSLGTFTVELTH